MKIKELKKRALKVYTFLENRISIIPKAIWILAAIFGIFIAGIIFTILNGVSDFERAKDLKEQNERLIRLAEGYEKLLDLYNLQGDNIGVILNPDVIYNHPDEIEEALTSIDQFKGQIQVQYGRILEMRDQAGLPDLSTEQSN